MSGNAIYEIFVGGLMLGSIFMATDYTTSPMTKKGQVIFAIGCGLITTVIRIFGGYPEGVSYSILLMNLCVPLIDKFVTPRVFGEVK
jgi:electron transport complex protein RnfD